MGEMNDYREQMAPLPGYNPNELIDAKTGEVIETRIARVETVQEWSLERVVEQAHKVNSLLQTVMKDGQHYGKIPGCGDKPTLLKPGAEKLGVMFRLAPRYKIEMRDLPNGHREYEVTCSLYHIHTQEFWGEGVGVCSTMESKYRYRSAQRKCPECGKETIIKGKEEFGGGWLCYKKKGGCGAKWNNGDPVIEKQNVGKVDNPDIADTYNTVKKMAKKRALVDATITATGASDIFTQDIEDFNGEPDKNDGMPYYPQEDAPPTTVATTSAPPEPPKTSPAYGEKARMDFVNKVKMVMEEQLPTGMNAEFERGLLIADKTVNDKRTLLKWFVWYICAGKKEAYGEKLLEWSKGRGHTPFSFVDIDAAPGKDIAFAYEKGKAEFKAWIAGLNGEGEPPTLAEVAAGAEKTLHPASEKHG